MEQRAEFVASLCREFGVSRKTGHKRIKRMREHGLGGLTEMSRRPRANSGRVGGEVEKLILKLERRHPNWGAKKLHGLLVKDCGVEDSPCVGSVHNILKRGGLTGKRRLRARFARPGPFDLTEAEHPNHVWAVDCKGWFVLGDGSRCDPLDRQRPVLPRGDPLQGQGLPPMGGGEEGLHRAVPPLRAVRDQLLPCHP